VTTMRIEDVLVGLKEHMTIVLVTNLVQQARRLADRTAFLNKGELVQTGPTELLFSEDPGNEVTYEYVHGVFG
jgi:phosphate transport system ATP-binding protein